jgi:hypothetical protein
MSGKLPDGLAEKVDLETAEQVMSSETSSKKDPGAIQRNETIPVNNSLIFDLYCTELGKMLPKLSKRISQSATQGLDSPSADAERAEDQRQRRTSSEGTPLDSAGVAVHFEGGEEVFFNSFFLCRAMISFCGHRLDCQQPSGRAVRHQTRASVTGVPNAAGGITVVVRTPVVLNPEVERLRTQDINPDENSAAYIALAAANNSSSAPNSSPEAEGKVTGGGLLAVVCLWLINCVCVRGMCVAGEGSGVVKRRMSMTRQLSGKYQRSTNRKVEGREIQQVGTDIRLCLYCMHGRVGLVGLPFSHLLLCDVPHRTTASTR